MDLENIIGKVISFGTEYGIKIIGAIVIWIIGSWIIKKLTKAVGNLMSKRNYDESLKKFLLNLIGWILKILLILSILGQLGVETTSFAAILAAGGLAVGMALQGSLANFAGGVLLMIFKPIKIGDLITAQGETGVVKEIEIFTTKLTTPDNKQVIIPNGPLSNGNITNFTSEGKLRIDHVIGISYDDDIKKAKSVLMDVLNANPKVLKDPAPSVNVAELGESSVNLAVRPFSTVEDYWDVFFSILEESKEALDKAGIEIPYPHSVEIEKPYVPIKKS